MVVINPVHYLQIGKMTPFKCNRRYTLPTQIAAHLLREMQPLTQGKPCSVNLPSAITLAGFYHCTVLDVLKALHTLKQNGFKYRLNGLDSFIFLTDTTGHYLKGVCKSGSQNK